MARTVALEVLLKYQNEQSYLNITLNDYLEHSTLSRSDKDLTTRIVYGTIQNKLYLEYQLAPYVKDKKIKGREKMILLMSLYQLIFLDKVPDYAVIDEAVCLAKKRDNFAGKFVNAILRNFLRNGKSEVEESDELKKLSIETSHPLWIVKMLSKQYDFETAKKICQHDNTPPTRAARVNTLKTTKANLLEDINFSDGNLSPDGILYKAGNIASTAYFKNGLVTIQDESSQLVAPMLAPQETDLVLDMCCAPGSKTAHLAAIMNNQGKIVAYDLFAHKIKLVEDNLKRLGVENVELHVGDATLLKEQYFQATFDKILLDAPCSGLGVMKRKPEIKYHDSSAMDTIIPLQTKLLDNAYYLLKKGGKMVYSTCTINKKENELMIKQFLEKYQDIKIVEEKKILPYIYDSDGFYMCKLEKGK
ncbi:16S rRNA (cytosine(967)-C(5))-methyltransferase RsmB [Thomasclavelia sp.]